VNLGDHVAIDVSGGGWLGADANWDLRNYHFYVPFAFLHGRMDLDVAVAHVATYYNPMLHLPFYWAVVHLPPRAVGFLAGAATGGFWFVAMWRRFGNPLFPYFNDVFHSPWALPFTISALCFAHGSMGVNSVSSPMSAIQSAPVAMRYAPSLRPSALTGD
jgi:hypothetical protein